MFTFVTMDTNQWSAFIKSWFYEALWCNGLLFYSTSKWVSWSIMTSHHVISDTAWQLQISTIQMFYNSHHIIVICWLLASTDTYRWTLYVVCALNLSIINVVYFSWLPWAWHLLFFFQRTVCPCSIMDELVPINQAIIPLISLLWFCVTMTMS